MKATQLSVKMMVDELNALEHSIDTARVACQEWLSIQKEREEYGSYDNEWANLKRAKMERALTEFRNQMSTVYDFQGDRGLVNFEPTGVWIDNSDEG